MYIIFDWNFVSKHFGNMFVTMLELKNVRNKLESGLTYILLSIIFDWNFVSKHFGNMFVTMLELKNVRNKLESGLTYVRVLEGNLVLTYFLRD